MRALGSLFDSYQIHRPPANLHIQASTVGLRAHVKRTRDAAVFVSRGGRFFMSRGRRVLVW